MSDTRKETVTLAELGISAENFQQMHEDVIAEYGLTLDEAAQRLMDGNQEGSDEKTIMRTPDQQRTCYCGRPMKPNVAEHADNGDPTYCYPEESGLDDESRCTAMEEDASQ